MPPATTGTFGGGNTGPCVIDLPTFLRYTNKPAQSRRHIHRLNDDCLTAIFYEVARYPPYGFNPTVFSETDRLICITHICQRWRELALDLAELWAEVVFVYPKAFRTFLERARDAPLSMRFVGASYEPGVSEQVHSKEHIDHIVAHPGRLRTLQLRNQPISSALAFAGITLPILEALHFDFSNDGPYFDRHGPALCAPLLRSAVFENHFTPLVAPRLTSLSMIVDDAWEYEIDAEYLQTLLRSLTSLEILWLENCLPADGWDIVSERRIKLPCLAKLQIAGSLSATTSMIETIDHINDYAYVELTIVDSEFGNEEDASSLASTLRPYLNSSRMIALVYTSILYSDQPRYSSRIYHIGSMTTYGLDRDEPLLQTLGAVATKAGRCIAFPNTYQHQVQPFSLADRSRPGHRKILALFLVDPSLEHPRPSTTVVPAQQCEWMYAAVHTVAASPDSRLSRLPVELLDAIVDEVEGLMDRAEAEALRLELMDERSAMVEQNTEHVFAVPFNMCEH